MTRKTFLFFLVSLACVFTLVLSGCNTGGNVVEPNPDTGDENYYNSDSGKGAIKGVEFELKTIPIQEVTLGTTEKSDKLETDGDGDGNDLKNQQYKVTLESRFRMGTTEVTQEMWQAVMKNNPSAASQKDDNNPVDSVSFFDVIVFCNELTKKLRGADLCVYYAGADNHVYTSEDAMNKTNPHFDKTKRGFRLPTLEEWEVSASCNCSTKYAGTSEKTEVEKFAWMKGNADGITHRVKTKKPNDFGLYDMNGNVWEWCWDWTKDGRPTPDPEPNRATSNYTTTSDEPPSGVMKRIKKGGGCVDSVTHNNVADRRWGEMPITKQSQIGFRIACND